MTVPLLLFALFFQAPGYTISGAVVHGITGAPLNKARVSVAPSEQRKETTTVVTGPDGRFRFNGLRAGKYSLTAERLGFVRQAYKERYLYQGYATAIAVGEHLSGENLVFRMIPGAVVTGHVIDTRGDPVPGLTVQALRMVGAGSQRRIQMATQGSTDDRGYYRIHSLPAGTFALTVAGRPWQAQDVPGLEPMAYPVTYYPGTTNPDRAGTVRTEPGREARADFVVNAVAAVRVQGRLASSERKGQLSVTLTAPGMAGGEITYGRQTFVYGNTFTIEGVPLGRYFINLWEDQARLIGRRAIEVTSSETTISISETPLARVSATVELRGSPQNPGGQTVLTLRHVNGTTGASRALDREGQVVFPSIPPGRYEVYVLQKRFLAVLSMTARGAALAGGLLDVPETGLVELAVVADASAPDVTGYVLRGEEPHAGILVMLVPRIGWNNFSAFRFDQSDSDGSFTWHSVPPGDYLMLALEEGEPMDYADPDVIRSLLSKAEPVSVDDGPQQSVVLRLPPRS